MIRPADSATTRAPSTAAPASGSDTRVGPALVDGVDVGAVARAVRACAGVADLYTGRFGEIGSYMPGRRVGGVQVDDTAVTVHIKARWGYSTRDLLAQTSAVTVALRNGRRLSLVVDDIDDALTGPPGLSTDAVTAVAPPRAIEPPAAPTTPAASAPPATIPSPVVDSADPPPESSTS